MARWHARKGRSASRGRYVELPHWIMASNAWLRLKPVERCTWLEIVAFYNGSNNGCIAAPTRLIGDRIGVSHVTVSRALNTLITLGFIETVRKSDFSRKTREASEFRLTHLKCDKTGALPAKTFMRLGSSQAVPKTAGRADGSSAEAALISA